MANLEALENPGNFLSPLKVQQEGNLFIFNKVIPEFKREGGPINPDLLGQIKEIFNKVQLALYMAELSDEDLVEIHLEVALSKKTGLKARNKIYEIRNEIFKRGKRSKKPKITICRNSRIPEKILIQVGKFIAQEKDYKLFSF